MVDRYTRAVLTVIALCLVYLCLLTTMSQVAAPVSVQARAPQGATRPGFAAGTAEVVIVGWRAGQDVPVVVRNTLTTTPANDRATRVALTGWEDARGTVRPLSPEAGVPVDATGTRRPVKVVVTDPDSQR